MSNRKLYLLLLLSVFIVYTTCRKVEKIMMVTTGTVSDISSNSVKVSGQIIDEGEGATQYGHYISAKANETAEGSREQSVNKSATGEYTTQLTSLLSDTKYYIKSYISDGEKTVYGKEISFNTLQAIANPEYVSSQIANAAPTILEMTYNLTLANIVPATSAFTVMVNSTARSVSSVLISGTKVMLTLASAVIYADVVTVAYTKPATNQLQTASGGQAASITAQSVTNNVAAPIPLYISSQVANAAPAVLEMTYNLTLANIVPATSAFTVIVNSTARSVSSVSISGTKVMLTLGSAIVYGDVVTVAYTKPATNQLQTASEGQAASITAQSVTNNVGAVLPVYVSSLVANATPTILEMTYSLTLANIVPATSAFTVMVNSTARSVSSVSISGTKVMLTLSSAVVYGDVVTVAYTKPTTNPLQTSSGGEAASIIAQSVTNNVTSAVPVYVSSVIEDATPTVLEMTYNLTLANIVPSASAFIVLVNSGGIAITNITISGTKVILTLTNPVNYGDIVTVTYTKPSTNPLQTQSGGIASNITSQTVTNNCLSIPVVITTLINNVTITSANSGGDIINIGGASVTNRGVCWSTNSNPNIEDKYSDEGAGTGSFESFITGLSSNTTYYVRAYATNIKGTGYGNEFIFKTFTGTVKDIENNSYYTVTIGTQIWMAANLKTTRLNDGTIIPPNGWSTPATPAYCWYNNDGTQYKNSYGALYNWYALISDKLCPTGWHVPSYEEWTTLTTYLGGVGVAGGKLKESGTVHWSSPNTGATNETGFTALPGGFRRESGYFDYIGNNSFFWSVTLSSGYPWYAGLQNDYISMVSGSVQTGAGLSVRCLQGEGQVLPTISTTEVSLITQTTATSGGNITSDGGAPVIARGVCWSISPNPTADGNSTDDGPGTGAFTSYLTGLVHGTTYYLRAYAKNSVGTAYGDQVSFTTAAELPTLTTILISEISTTTANSGGNITDDGGSPVTARGICWSTLINPTISNDKTSNGQGTGVFISTMTGLMPGTTYYVKAYATNSVGTEYGNQQSFKTDPTNVTDIEGNIYNVVRIGSQLWMAENLKVTRFNNGDPIPNITVGAEWDTPLAKYCNYDNSLNNGSVYGRLYNSAAISDSRKICPIGWHLSREDEWITLKNYLIDNGFGYQGSGNDIAKSLASKSGWTVSTISGAVGNNQETNNSSGFSGLPGGYRETGGKFSLIMDNGIWWSVPNGWPQTLNYNSDSMVVFQPWNSGLSVRCLKD